MPQRFIPQAGVIPIRRDADGVEVCLITSTGGSHWGFPKGIIEGGDPQETALTEAFEEAGLHGEIIGEPLGSYHYEKWDAELEVTVYLMNVKTCDDDWPESGVRRRAWLSAEKALGQLDRPQLRHLLSVAIERLRQRELGNQI